MLWNGNGTLDQVQGASQAITRDGSTWVNIGFTWYPGQGAGHDDLCTQVASGGWQCEQDDLQAFGDQPTYVYLGENQCGVDSDDLIDVDKVVFISGFQQACPW